MTLYECWRAGSKWNAIRTLNVNCVEYIECIQWAFNGCTVRGSDSTGCTRILSWILYGQSNGRHVIRQRDEKLGNDDVTNPARPVGMRRKVPFIACGGRDWSVSAAQTALSNDMDFACCKGAHKPLEVVKPMDCY